jgi:ketosteroid isomerase-like protein
MKMICSGLLVAILTVGLSPARGDDKKADTAAEVKALDAKLTDAFKAREFKLLGKHMDEGYIMIDPRGAVHNKTKYLSHLAEGTAKFTDLKETDVKVRVFSDTAVVTGLLQIKAKVGDKEVSPEYRWTRVYNKKGDEWLCVLEQHTHVVPKEEKK